MEIPKATEKYGFDIYPDFIVELSKKDKGVLLTLGYHIEFRDGSPGFSDEAGIVLSASECEDIASKLFEYADKLS